METLQYKKNNLNFNQSMSVKLIYHNCNNTKIISQEKIKKEFQKNEIFKCNKCNIIMNPIEIIADF